MPPPVLPRDVYRAFNQPNDPLSGAYQPPKGDIIALLEWILDAIAGAGGDAGAVENLRAQIVALQKLVHASDGRGARISDSLGRVLASFDAAGIHATGYGVGGVAIREALGFAPSDIIVTDRLGRVVRYLGPRPDGQDFSAAEVREADDRATADSAHHRLAPNSLTASLSWAVTAVIVYGQSLGQGWETWPVKTTTPAPGVLMLGQSVRPDGATDNPSPTPLGDSILRPAVATSQRIDTGALLTAQQQAALQPGDLSLGEEPGLVACQYAKTLHLQAFGLRSDNRSLAVVNTAVGGQTIERLSKGASPELFNRNRVMSSAVRSAAIAQGADSVGLGAVLYFGNEYNYDPQYGGTTDKEQYKAKLRQLRLDLISDVQQGIFGQPDLPAVITYQTSGTWVVDTADMSIGMAQYEASLDPTLGWYLAAPSYPVTDKVGHLDANGCRWLACHVGRAMHHVMTLRRGWRPTSPLSVVARGRTVLATFHTPSGTGLQFQPMYYGSAPSMLDNRGFTVFDDGGAVKVVDVQILAPRVVRLTLARSLLGNASLYYGRASEGGGGNLCDRDPAIFPFSYIYQAGSGDYPQANNDLVGKPYPAWNYCVTFKHAITRV